MPDNVIVHRLSPCHWHHVPPCLLAIVGIVELGQNFSQWFRKFTALDLNMMALL